jgi:hypothetical protein
LSPERRRLVLDADINWKLAHELRKRGRADATALRLEGMDHLKDGALLKALAEDFEPFVLVTWDNKMQYAHRAELAHFGSTLAVVNRRGLAAWGGTEESYVRNAVHRWLHLIEFQNPATTVLYSSDRIARTPPR